MPNDYGQFDQGKGQKYAPKAAPVKRAPPARFEAAPRQGPTVEDSLRRTLRDERRQRQMQYTDDHQ